MTTTHVQELARASFATVSARSHDTIEIGRTEQRDGRARLVTAAFQPRRLAPKPKHQALRASPPPAARHALDALAVRGAILQRRLEVGRSDDPLEHEAERIAERVTANLPIAPNVQRRCSCGGVPGPDGECAACKARRLSRQGDAKPVLRASPSSVRGTAGVSNGLGPESIAANLVRRAAGGESLPLGVTRELEPAFRVDFSSIRVHTDAHAHRLAAALGADAFTVGSDIFFGSDKWHPESGAGRHLLVHELVHTVQQSGVSPIVQCFVPCSRARLSLEDCPKREHGEVEASLREPMIVEYLDAPVQGYVIARFGAGQSRLKAGVTSNPNWTHLVQALSDANTQWESIGLSDCHGEEVFNTSLRRERADAVRAALPAAAATQISGTRGAALDDCITDNTSRDDRSWNRAVLIALQSRRVDFPDEKIEGTRPVPKPVPQPTSDCPPSSQREIDAAKPIAIAMAEKALAVLGSATPATDGLLKKYFNDSSATTYLHVLSGFRATLSGLRTSVTIACEHKGSWFYDTFCSSSPTSVTVAYVWPLGFRVHLCEPAFGSGDLDLARTLVHEFSHLFDRTDDEEYCPGGCSSSLDRWDAYDNADSYAGFASEAYLL